MPAVSATTTARDKARAELTHSIKKSARAQLAEVGPQNLSLRAVSRDLGMASSALYRYFPSREDLLTALIVDAYDAVGAAAERAAAKEAVAIERWRAVWHAVRRWARRNPHEYSLIYGSPIPGYRAPADTVAPAARVALALAGSIRDGWGAGAVRPPESGPELPAEFRGQLASLAKILAPELPDGVLARLVVAWTQLFGTVSFELFGQFAGELEPADGLFGYTVEQMAEFVGLR